MNGQYTGRIAVTGIRQDQLTCPEMETRQSVSITLSVRGCQNELFHIPAMAIAGCSAAATDCRFYPALSPPSRRPIAQGIRQWQGSGSTPVSFQSCWQSSRSHLSDWRSRFSSVTSETSATPANLARTRRFAQGPPLYLHACMSSVRSTSATESNPRSLLIAPVLRPRFCPSLPETGLTEHASPHSATRMPQHNASRQNSICYLSAYGPKPCPTTILRKLCRQVEDYPSGCGDEQEPD